MPHHTFAEQLECVFISHAVRSLIYMAQGIAASAHAPTHTHTRTHTH